MVHQETNPIKWSWTSEKLAKVWVLHAPALDGMMLQTAIDGIVEFYSHKHVQIRQRRMKNMFCGKVWS
jgi:hypothetical protein